MKDQPGPMTDLARAAEATQEADCRLARGERDAAVAALERALGHDPFNEEVALMAAMIRFEDGELARAASLALEAIRVRPFNPPAMNLLGVTCLDSGYTNDARRILGWVVAQAPGLRGAKRNLRHARRASGRATPVSGFPVDAVRASLAAARTGLSVCLAATEDAAGVDTTLESLAGTAAEIVVTDATPDGLTPQTPWPDSMKWHRLPPSPDRAGVLNAAIRRAGRDWVLLLDPGETLHPESVATLLATVRGRGALYHEIEIRGAKCEARWLQPRLFRNAPGVRFAGSVHPTVRPCLRALATQWRLASKQPGIVVETQGPVSYAAEGRGKNDLQAAMTRHELSQSPADDYLVVQHARVQLEAGEPREALETLETIDPGSEPGSADPEELATLHGRCLVRLERYVETRERIGIYHRSHRPTRNTLFLEGVAAHAAGDPASAVRELSRCLRDTESRSFLPPFPEITGAGLPNMLGAAMLDLGRLDEARGHFETALEREPGSVESRLGLLGLRLASGEIEPLLQELDRWIEEQGDNPRVWSCGAVLLGRIPELAAAAASWMEEACRRFPENVDLRRQQAEVLLRGGSADAARRLLNEAPSDTPAALAAHIAASLTVGAELPIVPVAVREAVEREVLCWLQQWMASSAYAALDRALLDMVRTGARLPGLASRTAGWLDEIGQTEAAERIRQELASGATVGS